MKHDHPSRDSDMNNNKRKLEECDDVELATSGSIVNLRKCKRIRLEGNTNWIIGREAIQANLRGDQIKISLHNTVNAVWSGSGGLGKMVNEGNARVFGKNNKLVATGNANLLIVGHSNKLVAEDNTNLKLRGHGNFLRAFRTMNLVVDGNNGHCIVSDVDVSHKLIKSSSGCETQVYFRGVVCPSILFEGRVDTPVERQYVSYYKISKELTNASDESQGSKQFKQEINVKRAKLNFIIPEVIISYVDKALVRNKTYVLGIFSFEVEGLKVIHDGKEIVLRLVVNFLDRGSYNCQVIQQENCILISGSKDGRKEDLRLVGDDVTRITPLYKLGTTMADEFQINFSYFDT